MSVNYKLAVIEGDKFLTLFGKDGDLTVVTTETHGNFDEILSAALADNEELTFELADTGRAIQRKFDDVVAGRVAVRGGVVFFDDDPVDNALTKAILRFLEAGEDFAPLVRFFENVMANPQPESREQFYRWVEHHDFPIDDEGNIVAYKSVQSAGNDEYLSISSGRAFVNGVEQTGRIRQSIGDVVTMPRSEVQHDPNVACHVGLHAGTFEYASTFTGDTLMYVLINPRDVVSVPHDCTSQKVRVCRYEILNFAEGEHDGPRFRTDEAEPLDEDEDYYNDFLADPEEDDEYTAMAGNSNVFMVGDQIAIKEGRYEGRFLTALDKTTYEATGMVGYATGHGAELAPDSFYARVNGVNVALWDDEAESV